MGEVNDFLEATGYTCRGQEGSEDWYPDESGSWIFSKYKITKKEREDMYVKQNGCCAICGVHQSKIKRKLFIDHNHEKKGKESVRGLLCFYCNSMIGFSKDDLKILTKAIKYLRKYK